MRLDWAAEAMGARVVGKAEGVASGVCTDTRQGVEGALFFALMGEKADGHAYARQAFENGAVGAVVSREVEGVAGPLLVVPDTLRALGDLARAYRRQFSIPVIAITGSIGKTSTKEMIATVLRSRFNVLASEKNFNNEIGVPLTLLRLNSAHEAAVIEMGMRGLGEIDRLAEIAEPTIGVITNIGHAHIELLGSQDAIAQAKSELLTHLPAGGYAILPYYHRFFDYLQSRVPEEVQIITFGDEHERELYVYIVPLEFLPNGTAQAHIITHKESSFLGLHAVGVHHLDNAGAAIAVAYALDIPLKEVVAALETWPGAEGRMTVIAGPNGITVFDDCYNAGPESMVAALATLALGSEDNNVAVLGDMRELGDFAPQAHRMVGQNVIEANLRLLVTVGELAAEIAAQVARHAQATHQTMPETRAFADAKACAAEIRALVRPGERVLVKGSRAMEMEVIVEALTGQRSANAHD